MVERRGFLAAIGALLWGGATASAITTEEPVKIPTPAEALCKAIQHYLTEGASLAREGKVMGKTLDVYLAPGDDLLPLFEQNRIPISLGGEIIIRLREVTPETLRQAIIQQTLPGESLDLQRVQGPTFDPARWTIARQAGGD